MRIKDLLDGSQSWASSFASAILNTHTSATELPLVLMYYPVAQVNPFQQLLYCAAAENAVAAIPIVNLEDVDTIGWSGRAVLHLHWLMTLFNDAKDESEAEQAVQQFAARLAGWKRRGIKVIWTVHNILPHVRVFPQAELMLRQLMAREADVVHVMNAGTIDRTQPHFQLSAERTMHVAHPSYTGWYANIASMQHARFELDIGSDEFVFLLFGSLQGYKGVVELLDAFGSLSIRHPIRKLRLIIAGKPSSTEYAETISEHIAASQYAHRVVFLPQTIPENQLQYLFNAANVVVAPYLQTLNSGVMLLAATFRRPIVAPRDSAARDIFDAGTALLYDNAGSDELLEALEQALSHQPSQAGFDRILRRYDPKVISNEFFTEMKQRVLDKTEHQGNL